LNAAKQQITLKRISPLEKALKIFSAGSGAKFEVRTLTALALTEL